MMAIMTDSVHLPNFKHHSGILHYLCSILSSGVLSIELSTDADNVRFVVNNLT